MANGKKRENVCAIFVHGGAGSHSHENEHKHLEVLAKAAEAAMAFLKRGATAVQAVEVAIMVLEDEPILNAGTGSNLTVRGRVECDASIVDHLGRSGAAGAVPSVKNPIMLARKIYDESPYDPGVSRIAPNLLVGEGAADFAWNRGIVIVTNSSMITDSARSRWQVWCREAKEYDEQNPPKHFQRPDPWVRRPVTPMSTRLARLAPGANDNADAVAATGEVGTDSADIKNVKDAKTVDGHPPQPTVEVAEDTERKSKAEAAPLPGNSKPSAEPKTPSRGVDDISDTVGAIAVDSYGNIAAGSSSGGVGMKHRGRVGPAALIGIGTHVIPVDPTDPEHTSVAAVTSGTGEQIATSFAASTCAQRIYYSQKMGNAGVFEEVTEEEALVATIQREFLRHPSCLNHEIMGCIGVMAVKKTDDGIVLYFAHTTESMSLASMSGYDDEPLGCLSRNKKPNFTVASGGLMIRGKKINDGPNKKPKTTHN